MGKGTAASQPSDSRNKASFSSASEAACWRRSNNLPSLVLEDQPHGTWSAGLGRKASSWALYRRFTSAAIMSLTVSSGQRIPRRFAANRFGSGEYTAAKGVLGKGVFGGAARRAAPAG